MAPSAWESPPFEPGMEALAVPLLAAAGEGGHRVVLLGFRLCWPRLGFSGRIYPVGLTWVIPAEILGLVLLLAQKLCL